MKMKIKNKLRSQAGASISFALLLFLVCAVLCSVIITAATAASGRMSRIAETDQRYYAVTSAAELMKDLIDGKKVSVVEVVETTYKTTYTNGVANVPSETTMSDPKVYIVPDKKANQVTETDDYTDQNLIESIDFTIDSILEDAAMKIVVDKGTLNRQELTISSTPYSEALSVTVLENLDKEGNIELYLFNKFDSKGKESVAGSQYKVVMSFGAEKKESTSTKTENVSSSENDEGVYTVITKSTTTTITTLTWTLTGILTNPEE